jgi:hypothetical protein
MELSDPLHRRTFPRQKLTEWCSLCLGGGNGSAPSKESGAEFVCFLKKNRLLFSAGFSAHELGPITSLVCLVHPAIEERVLVSSMDH